MAASEASDSSVVAGNGFSAAVAAVVRAPPKDFMVVRQEWAAIRIQTAFRGLLVNGFRCFYSFPCPITQNLAQLSQKKKRNLNSVRICTTLSCLTRNARENVFGDCKFFKKKQKTKWKQGLR